MCYKINTCYSKVGCAFVFDTEFREKSEVESENELVNTHQGPGLRPSLNTHNSALKCLKPLIRRFKSAVWIKPNKNTFQILYETISDWY